MYGKLIHGVDRFESKKITDVISLMPKSRFFTDAVDNKDGKEIEIKRREHDDVRA